jgi:hypothetical protein
MSGAHGAHDDHGGGHGHTGSHHDSAPVDDGPQPAPLSESERYELGDLFPDEAPENRHFVMVAGTVILVVLLGIALAYPFLHI